MGQYIRMILDILTHIFLAIISISYAIGEAKFGEENNVANDTKAIRKQKQFSLFTIVTFPNDECAAQSGSTTGAYYGTCLSSSECSANSGSVDGNCASGFGVCCTYRVKSCGSSVTKNCTYIQNPGYSSTYTVTTTTSCSYTVTPLSSDICQLRLDFQTFSTVVATTGICTDSFKVTGNTMSSRTTTNLCGTLTGQHLYVENGRGTSGITVAFTIATTTTALSWNIKINQIECSSTSKAPTDCSQWYTGNSGTITSFNRPGGTPLQSSLHSYCVRRNKGFCTILYQANSGVTSPTNFKVASTALPSGGGLAPAQGALYIANTFGQTSLSTLYLNDQHQPPVTSVATVNSGVYARAPFKLYHVTTTISQAPVEGFNLQYNQIGCGADGGS